MSRTLSELTQEWGSREHVTLYLDRCRVDTPEPVVSKVWSLISENRGCVGKVIDFGAGDGRFAKAGTYKSYIGFEIDPTRCVVTGLPVNAKIVNKCAFSEEISDADLCIGNPPYVRNQDLPRQWKKDAARIIETRTAVAISGLANAWQYFTFLSLASTKPDGLVALVIPYEWVSRPSAHALRAYIRRNGWNVDVYRLRDETFHRVLTTSAVVLVDKQSVGGRWRYFEEQEDGVTKALESPSGAREGVVAYSRPSAAQATGVARRGLSPGTQSALTLTESERKKHNLRIGRDVVRCVTSLRPMGLGERNLTPVQFRKRFRDAGRKCWLVRTDRDTSPALRAYLDSVPEVERDTGTCNLRKDWWRFEMPVAPPVLVASGFRDGCPKAVVNSVRAVAVGSVCAVFGLTRVQSRDFVKKLQSMDLSRQIVAHSNGLRKLEIGQLQTVVSSLIGRNSDRAV